jgi:putative endonuclease
VWSGGFELDLVVRRGRTLVFCEVKGKSGAGFGDPLEMITQEKAQRVRRAAATWLAAHPEHGGCTIRFDVVAERSGRLERVAQAF